MTDWIAHHLRDPVNITGWRPLPSDDSSSAQVRVVSAAQISPWALLEVS